MGYFDQKVFDKADLPVNAEYFSPGRYKLRIEECKARKNHEGVSQFIGVFSVLESNNPETPVGSKRSLVIKLAGFYWAKDLISLSAAVLGHDLTNSAHQAYVEAKVKPNISQLLDAAIEKAAFAGKEVLMNAVDKVTVEEDTGKEKHYTKCYFKPAFEAALS